MRVVVTGGTGFLGTALVGTLTARGDEVAVLTRRSRGGSRAREVEWVPGGSTAGWAPALEGADAVVHLAGESLDAHRWSPAQKAAIVESRVVATRTIVTGIERAANPPRLLVSASAVGYYGPRGDEVITEEEPPGRDFLARLCVDWERDARRAEAAGVRVVTLRSGLILAREGGALPRMLLPFRLGLGGPLGTGRQFWPWIHRDDWVSLVSLLLSHPAASGPFNVTAPTPVTNREFTRTLGRVLRRPAVLPVPGFALRVVLGEMAGVVLTGQRAVPARALALGYSFQHEALEPALRSLLG